MPCTALQIEKEGVMERFLFMTVPTINGVDVDIFMADEEFNPIGTASVGISPQMEEDYHKELRLQASEKGHFVPDYSTHPEWNPDYKPEEPTDVQSNLH